MANTKISQLAAGAPALGTDLLPIDRSGANFSLKVSDILASPALTGFPSSPTLAPFSGSISGSHNTALATVGYVDAIVYGGGEVYFVDDFLMINPGGFTVAASEPLTSDTMWDAAPITGGTTGTVLAAAGSFINPGQIMLNTPATTGDGVCIAKVGTSSSFGPFGVLGSNANWEVDFWIQTPSVITNYAVRVGFATGATGYKTDAPTGGVWAEFDTANANSNTNWTLRTVNSSASNFVSSGVAVAASTFYHIRIASSVSGTISLQVGSANGALSAAVTSSTDIDTTNPYQLTVQLIPRTTSAVSLIVDRVSYIAASGRV
jgi:hypothetical protein